MDESIIPVLSLITLLIVSVFALMNKARTGKHHHDPAAPIPILAKDGKNHGGALIKPPRNRTYSR